MSMPLMHHPPRARCGTPTALAMLLALGAAAPAAAQGDASRDAGMQSPALRSRTPVTLNFVNADIDAVSRAMSAMIDRAIVVDPRVRGAITLYSEQPQTVRQAYLSFLAALRGLGFTVVENNGLLKVVPEADAKLQTGTVSVDAPTARGDTILTQIFRLSYENPNNLVAILRPLISPNNTINANPASASLVITDYADNLQRIAKIIAALDQPSAADVEVVPLKHAVAADLAPLVQRLAADGGQALVPGAPAAAIGGGAVQVLPDGRANALIVRAPNNARLGQVRALIDKLDVPAAGAGPAGQIWVVHLKNADATKLATVLRAAFATGGASGAGGAASAAPAAPTAPTTPATAGLTGAAATPAAAPLAASTGPSTGGFVQADPATNSLIITAPEPVYRELRAVIDKLDQRRAQVFVESLIAEVRADRAADFGVQWQSVLRNNGSTIGVIGTNYSTTRATGGSTTNIFDIAAAVLGYRSSGNVSDLAGAVPNTGFNLALGSRTLGLLANFIQSSGAGNVLSTPTLLTLDNEEAKIIVGQNVPFVTGSYTNTGSSSTSVNPFQTFERKDVGLTLRVRPQISEDGTIKMVIYQETSSVVASTVGSSQGPITNKRAIESSVLVGDGAVVVLGGLLEDQFATSEDKLPGLGDIPVLGNLFKNQNRSYVKTNLMVFLRPVIVRDGAAAESFSLDRYDYMRAAQSANQPPPSSVLQINQAPVLPAVQPVNPEAWKRPAPPPPLIRPPAAGENSDPGSGTTFTRP